MNITISSTLTAAALTTLITDHHPDWQACFLNDDHQPVIGILPKVSWRLSADDTQGKSWTLTMMQRQADLAYTQQHLPSSYHDLLDKLSKYSEKQANHNSSDQACGYQHGLMGFVGYDIAAHALNDEIELKSDQPASFFGHYDIYLKPVAQDGKCGFVLICQDDDITLNTLINELNTLQNQALPKAEPLSLAPIWSKDDYQAAFEKAQTYLLAGDGYQINLTQAWLAAKSGKLSAHLPNLMSASQAPFAGFLQVGDFELLSVSPELFFTFYKQNNSIHIITKPIKGTRPRASDPVLDEQYKQALATSQKDISENLMIVDLLRNDLGKYAEIGSVKTPVKFAIESFSNVHHMVSTITATLKDDSHPIAVLFGSLPAGSITGAPKKRACEMIFELESAPRGAYCGSMGYLNFDGTGQFNVLIRTIQANADSISVWAGGGITIRSQVDDEYQECMDKVGMILKTLADG
ncbi:anthranilate synthase component I family protein [Moraxella sp. FZLJ2107]|uniref:anthranilate synthase component I family protein n=1 Tax=unclassified Moraxella TaxID=2685852 RepID=UPI0020C856B3|nr:MULTISPECIES: anthranilate synthase component I family protein [unclassified Moraxella]UTO04148.1 anthranilate synthase component I family protein [Moraxella sp. FZLJ2107]UTO22981.1 anthranilate synthase component I family protein [Moraxella sp. FZLJ2109]